ncbi:unnamed protein product [Symbiodinium sp. CCMP2456]|nr:unnamed protein product [Symbiodinium sp. CCMP2456]
MLMYKIYTFLTKCVVQAHAPIQELVNNQHELPSFMRDTASKRLKDPEISRIQDNVQNSAFIHHYHACIRFQISHMAWQMCLKVTGARCELCFTSLTGTRRECGQSAAWTASVLTGSTVGSILSGTERDVWAATLRGSETAFGEGRQKLKAYYINTDLDDARRSGLESTCVQLDLDCERVMPPKLSSEEVLNCVDSTPLRSFECSLVYAHRGILKQISSGTAEALVLEDDARLNGDLAAESAKEMLQSARERDFVMAGWCDPSCAHAYLVSPGGAKMLLGRGFARRVPRGIRNTCNCLTALQQVPSCQLTRCFRLSKIRMSSSLVAVLAGIREILACSAKIVLLLTASLIRAPEALIREDQSHDREQTDSVVVDEVKVKALQTGSAQLRKTDEKNQEPPPPVATSSRNSLLKAVSSPQACCAALAGLQQNQAIAKPATEIMRPLVFSIIQESEEFSRMIDTKKEDIVVAFMEQCREGVRDAPGRDFHRDMNGLSAPPLELRMREIEETSVRVFETLAKRAELLVDSLTKSPPEFWKVWTTFYPALADFSESSPIFESALYFFRRLGELMREQDAQLTQQMMTDVALASLAKELARSPEKRDLLCDVVYSFVQEDTLNHILTLRALKEKVGDDLAVYVPCLASLINLDGQAGLLDEHLLDLYIYYALMAIQSPKPRVRVAGLAIICSVTGWSSQHQPVVALLQHFSALANDEWWEVQAQLLRLSAKLLGKLSTERGQAVVGAEDDGSASGASRLEEGAEASVDAVIEEILSIVSRLFVVSNSKNVLQVGLSALVHVLPDYPNLLPVFVAVLLGQTPALRQRLLQEPAEGDDKAGRTYVHGNFTCTYEETCLPEIWPHLDIAKTLTMQLEASPPDHLETEHLEVLLASLPFFFDEDEADEWFNIFEKVKKYVFTALVDPHLHLLSTQIIRKFWASGVETIAAKTRENSLDMMAETLSMLYDGSERVEEASVIVFLREMRGRDDDTQAEVDRMIDHFAESHPDKYQASQLHTVSQE